MDRIWTPRYVVDVNSGTESSTVSFPQLLDVATQEDTSFSEAWLAAKDGTLWRHGGGPIPPRSAGQEPAPGSVTGLAVAIDGGLWIVTDHRQLWHRRLNGQWDRIPVPAGIEPLVDVTVHHRDVWIVRDDGAMWRTSDGTFEEMTTVIPFMRLSGRDTGDLWGISLHPSANLFRRTADSLWQPVEGGRDKSWADISVSFEGKVWLVATDGTVWTTTDGISYLKVSADSGFTRIMASRFESPWAVKADGTLWAWWPKPTTPIPPAPPAPAPPPPAPPVPPPSAVRPQLTVTTTGSGDSTVFHFTGSGFLPSSATTRVDVTIRGARIDDGGVPTFYWVTQSSDQGTMTYDLPLACVPGLRISFSANDGRRDPHDFTDRFWSNTVTVSCP
ncbi:MAG: hypothetical protein HOV83_28470 [Catenulispora sp.]|nr:hypothetical protein [Catenulispora sp.]